MIKRLKTARIPITLLLILVMLIPLFQGIKVSATYETVWFESFESGTSADGWSTPYGGTITRSTDFSAMGDYSLKITGRTKAWQSPAKNIYSIIRENGAGKYTISMKVLTTAVNPEIPKIGTLIRTTKENSFSKYHSGNYFYRLVGKYGGVTANTWFTLSGTVDILDSDISAETGLFRLMFDILEPVDGQAVYIDEVYIQKQEVNTDFTFYYDPINVCIGETKEIYLNPYSSPYTAYFESGNYDIAVVSPDGKVTGISEGTTSIYVTRGGVSRTCTVNVSSKHYSILNGEYYIRNAQMKKYLQIDDGDKGNNYSSNKVIMELWNFDNESEHKHQLWNFIYLGDGYYKIISSISGRALSVK